MQTGAGSKGARYRGPMLAPLPRRRAPTMAVAATPRLIMGIGNYTEEDIKDAMNVMGVHDDLYRKVDDKWYFEKTRYDFLYPRRIYQGPRIPI